MKRRGGKTASLEPLAVWRSAERGHEGAPRAKKREARSACVSFDEAAMCAALT